MTAVVIAKKNSVAAGRDVNIRIVLGEKGLDVEASLKQICQDHDLDYEQLMQALRSTGYEHLVSEQVFEALNRLIAEQSLQNASSSLKYTHLAESASEAAALAESIAVSLGKVQAALESQDYGVAYSLLRELLLADTSPPSLLSQIANDCLHCGFLHFANTGQTSSFDDLLSLMSSASEVEAHPNTLYLIAEMQQEHATRQISTDGLWKNLKELRSLKEIAKDDPEDSAYVTILEGLCLRRIGERGDKQCLVEAEETLSMLSPNKHSRPIEALNNLAITQIRLFSVAGDHDAIKRAKSTLEMVPALGKNPSLSEYQAYPKFLNNYGNYYKQCLKLSKASTDYAASIEMYTAAERYWSEDDAPYEWAMLQKNKADVRSIFITQQGQVDSALLLKAHNEILASLRHRTKENAERQYERSFNVLRRIEEIARSSGISLDSENQEGS
ncbi:MAG: hypothetical protein AAGG09_01680 [Pseudomonadota bacterium]